MPSNITARCLFAAIILASGALIFKFVHLYQRGTVIRNRMTRYAISEHRYPDKNFSPSGLIE